MKKNTVRRFVYIFSVALEAGLLLGSPLYMVTAVEASVRLDDEDLTASREIRQLFTEKFSALEDKVDSFSQDEIIVKFKNDAKPFRVLKIPPGSVHEHIAEYSKREDVEYAEPNFVAHAFLVPNDPYYTPYQWHFDNPVNGGVHAGGAWDVSNGSGVVVAVLDTGVAYENYTQGVKRYYKAPDLSNTAFVSGYDFVNNDSHPNDDEGHGTHVTGTIAQSTGNGTGVAGLAYGASIMPIKVLDRFGSGTHAQIASGIRYAADRGAKVINLSLGGSTGSQTLEDALAYVHGKGVTIVAAAGNSNQNQLAYPAAYNEYVISVGATRYDESRAPYSNYGAGLDVMAPGGDTSVDQNGDGYGDGVLQQTFGLRTDDFGYYFYQGSSMASPHVAAVAALVLAHGNATTPGEVRAAIQESADDLGAVGYDTTFGNGLVNAAGALAWSGGVVNPPPLPTGGVLELLNEGFESGLGGFSNPQGAWARSSQRAYAGTYSAEVDGRATDAQLISNILDLQGKTNTTIAFAWYIENGLDAGEYVAFDVSTNGGTTWSEFARLRGNVDAEDTWITRSFEVTGITSNALKIRFRGSMSLISEDAFVDAVRVTAW